MHKAVVAILAVLALAGCKHDGREAEAPQTTTGSQAAEAQWTAPVEARPAAPVDEAARERRRMIFAQGLKQLRGKPLAEDIEPRADPRDKTPPTIAVPRMVQTDRSLANIEGSVTDPHLSEVRLDSRWVHIGPDGHFRTTRPVAPGTRRMSLVAVDQNGNRADTYFLVNRSGGTDKAPKPGGRDFALVIGEKSYRAPIPSPATAAADAEAVARLLAEDYGFKVTTLIDARKDQVLAALTRLRGELDEDDNLLVYWAGHSVLDAETGSGYWLPVDAHAERPDAWIPNRQISRMLRAMSARHVLVVADSCYSGAFARELTPPPPGDDPAWLRSRTALSSGERVEVPDGGGPSPFAGHFLDALRRNGGILSGRQLATSLRDKSGIVGLNYGAIVSAGHDDGGDFLFVRRAVGRSS